MLVINAAEPGCSVVQIGLIARCAAVFVLLRSKLNPGVRACVALNSVFKLELEVVNVVRVEQELITSQRFSPRNLTGNCLLLDTPISRIAAPFVQRLSIKDRGEFWLARESRANLNQTDSQEQ